MTRSAKVIKARRDSLNQEFDATKYVSQEVAEARRAGWLQALNWVLADE